MSKKKEMVSEEDMFVHYGGYVVPPPHKRGIKHRVKSFFSRLKPSGKSSTIVERIKRFFK